MVRLQKLSPLQIEEALADIAGRVSADAAAKSRAILFRAVRQAVKWGLVNRNPVEAVENIRVTRAKPKVWTPQEAATFFAFARPHRLFAAFYLGLACGLRRGEILGLSWEDVTPTGVHIRKNLTMVGGRPVLEQPKTQSGKRFVPYAPDVYEALLEHRERQERERSESAVVWPNAELVFTSLVGTPVNPNNLERTWYALQDRANGMDEALALALREAKGKAERAAARKRVKQEFAARRVQLHSLRRTFATWEIALNGADPKTLATKLGHTRASFTLDVYAQQFAEVRQASALSLLDILTTGGKAAN